MIIFELKLTKQRVYELLENDINKDYISSTDPLLEPIIRQMLCDYGAKDITCLMILNETIPSISLLFTAEADEKILLKVIHRLENIFEYYIESSLYEVS